ncbi:ABC transporter ATP-binding protein [Bacteroidota bacterium]
MKEILQIHELDIGYHKLQPVYEHINFSCFEGEFVAIIGKNGIGKSTLLKTIMKILQPIQGNILYQNNDINTIQRNDFYKLFSFVSTQPVRVNHLNVFDLVSFGRYPYLNLFAKKTVEDLAIVEESIQITGIQHVKYKNVAELSDGERQKALIARCIAQDTPVVILDEPLAHLDLPSKYEIISLLKVLSEKKGKTILVSIHDFSIAMEVADKIWFMGESGSFEGAPEDMLLEKRFDKFLSSSSLSLRGNTVSMNYAPRKEREIRVEGEGIYYDLSRKFLEKNHFLIVRGRKNVPELKIRENKEPITWILKIKEQKFEFNSIYDLHLHLKQSYTKN